jgi:iron(III) transport system substrate-binding protein
MLLKEKDVLAPYDSPAADDIPPAFRDPAHCWTGFAGRARVFIVNTQLLSTSQYPRSVEDLAHPPWPPEKSAVALPLFGTAATHAAALYAAWGPAKARAFFEQLRDSGVRIVDGNSVVRDMVADGRAVVGLTDTDDAAGAIERGAPVAVVYPDQDDGGLGAFVVPNTVAFIKTSPNPAEGKRLIDFLLSVEVEKRLVESGWCHVPLREVDARPKHLPSTRPVKKMSLSLESIHAQLERARQELTEVFIR